MSDQIDIPIRSTFDPKGADSAAKALRSLQQLAGQQAAVLAKQMQQSNAAGRAQQQAAAAASKVAQSNAQAGKAAAQLAIADQKVSQAAAQAATAQARLATEQQRTIAVAAQAAAALDRQAMSALRLAEAQERAAQRRAMPTTAAAAPEGDQGGGLLAGGLGRAAGVVAVVGGALSAAKALGETGAQAALVEQRFNALAQASGTTGDALMGALRAASGGEISDLNLQLAANRAQMLGVAKSAEEFSTLMEIARDRAQSLGMTSAQAFDDLVTGLGRGSSEILDNLGIMVSVEEVNKSFAASVGKSVEALTAQERKTALIAAVLQQGRASIEATGGAAESSAGQFATFNTGVQNLTDALGKMVAANFGPAVGAIGKSLNDVASNLNNLQKVREGADTAFVDAFAGSEGFEQYAQRIDLVNGELSKVLAAVPPLTQEQYTLAKAFEDQGMSAEAAIEKALELADAQGDLAAFGDSLTAKSYELGQAYRALMPDLIAAAGASEENRTKIGDLSAQLYQGTIDIETFKTQVSAMAAESIAATAAEAQHTSILQGLSAALVQVGAETNNYNTALADKLTKAQDAAQKDADAAVQAQQLAAAQQTLANLGALVAGGFMSASAAAAQMTNQYGIAYAAALALIRAQAALGQAKAAIPTDAVKAGVSTVRVDRESLQEQKLMQDNQRAAAAAHKRNRAEMAEAEIRYQRALGNYKPAIDQAKAQLDRLEATGKRNTAAYVDQQTKLLELQQQQESASKRAGGGGAGGGGRGGGAAGRARVSEAQKAADGIAKVEEDLFDRLVEVNTRENAALLAHDEATARRRVEIARQLAADIESTAADMAVRFESNDLDLVGADEDQLARLQAREQAEAEARRRQKEAIEEARQAAAQGEADQAKEVYAARQEQISAQQQLDEDYYNKRNELAGNDEALEQLKIQYDEATAVIQQQTDIQIELARTAAQQRAADEQAKRDEIIAGAEEERNRVITAAQDKAAGVKGASDAAMFAAISAARAAADGVIANYRRMADGANAAVASIRATPAAGGGGSTDGPATGSGGGGSGAPGGAVAAAGGASFVTRGRTTLTVGDNPGGRELVQVSPLSGKGTTRATGPAALALAGGGTVVASGNPVDQAAADAARILQGGTRPSMPSGGSSGGGGGGGGGAAAAVAQDLEKEIDQQRNVIALLQDLIALRGDLERAADQQPFHMGLIKNLLKRASEFVAMVRDNLPPIAEQESEALDRYGDAVSNSVGIIADVADLRTQLQESLAEQPFHIGLIKGLINRAKLFVDLLQAEMVPLTETAAERLNRYADGVGAVVGILRDVAQLRTDLQASANQQPFDLSLVERLADEASAVLGVITARFVPMTERTADGIGRALDTARGSVALIKDMADLRTALAGQTAAPISADMIDRLAADAERARAAVAGRLIPITEAQADQAQRYADVVGSSTSALKAAADLNMRALVEYTSPTDAQINRLADDGLRITRAMEQAAGLYSGEALDQARKYADGIKATYDAIGAGLVTIDRLNNTDIALDPSKLAGFADSSRVTLDTIRALSEQAATINPPALAQLGTVASVTGSLADSMIKMAAVPYADLPALAGAFGNAGAGVIGGAGGGNQTINLTIYNNVTAAPGMSAHQIAQMATKMTIDKINAEVKGRRY